MRIGYVGGLVGVAAALFVLSACSSGADESSAATDSETEGAASASLSADQVGVPGCVVEPPQVWVEEGELATAEVDCGDPNVEVDGPSGVEVSGGQLTWTPTLEEAGTYEIAIAAGGATGTWTVGVADAFDAADNSPVGDPQALTHEFGLEVLHVFPEEHLGNGKVDATLFHGGRSYPAEVSVRGATSLQHPKIGLDLEVDEGLRSADAAFDGMRELTLVAGFDDNSRIRNRLAQQLWSDMSDTHLTVSHASVVLYLDGRYMGVYTLLGDVGTEYVERNGLDPDAQVFKAEDERADFRLGDGSSPTAGFEKKNGEPETGLRSLDPIGRFVEFAALSDDSIFAADIESWVDIEDLVDWFAFTDFIAASDSTAKNAFWYQVAPEAQFRYIPWDFNHSFGQDWGTFRVRPDTDLSDLHRASNGLFERIYADPDLRIHLEARYEQLLDGSFSPASLTATAEQLAGELNRNLERDGRRWGVEYASYPGWAARTDVETAAGEVEYILDWIAARYEYISTVVGRATADS